ncbi:MAG: nitroreductase [Burkholderiales bacterium]|nr:nitroreductase [Burkholderiales bacterium]OJX09404.1 MAG: hypothetical protein BGO72_06560 [Burkholderiales bacterium 70-64]
MAATDLGLIEARRSPLTLREPGPDQAALDVMLSAAMRAPDHGRLKPWRFIVVSGPARLSFGRLLAESLARRDPDASGETLQREREKALRGPVILVVIAKPVEQRNVPRIEQVIAAGIAAYNVLLAATPLGFGGMWRTGPAAYDPDVKRALGIDPADEIVGFLYLGTPDRMPASRRPADPREHVLQWAGT